MDAFGPSPIPPAVISTHVPVEVRRMEMTAALVHWTPLSCCRMGGAPDPLPVDPASVADWPRPVQHSPDRPALGSAGQGGEQRAGLVRPEARDRDIKDPTILEQFQSQ